MRKYTEKELEEVQNLLSEENYESIMELIKYTRDEQIINKTSEYSRIRRF